MSDSSKHSGGVQPSHNQADNLIVENEAKRVWSLLFGPNKYVGTVDVDEFDGQYAISRDTFTEYFVAAFDRLTEVTDLQPSDSNTTTKGNSKAQS